ncbi:MAG TPA: DNRLRE domain-containing protein [Pirellulales bacterium]|nr:DNRLRE domain-containing protein [Pirellulales bacterium]
MNTRYFVPLLVGSILLAQGSAAWAASVTLTPDKDNTIVQVTSPTGQLSNGEGDIFVGRTAQDGSGATVAVTSIRRGLVHFNVAGSGIPSNAVITGVTLQMTNVMSQNGDQTLSLEPVTQDWGQGTSNFPGGVGAPATQNDATWLYTFYNATTPSASTTWNTPGGDFSGTISASTVDPGGQTGNVISWSSSQMVADVQSWLNDPSGNFGWGILGNESVGQTAKRLNSSESANPPQLIITYRVPEPASIALAFAGAVGLLLAARRRAA